jgi:hypothetical protein
MGILSTIVERMMGGGGESGLVAEKELCAFGSLVFGKSGKSDVVCASSQGSCTLLSLHVRLFQ